MIYKAVLFASVVAILCRLSIGGYEDCGSVDGAVISVEVSNCPPKLRRCILKRNTNATMDISFTTTNASNTVTAIVHGVILGVPVPFDLPNADGCKDSGVECPLKPGTTYKYTATLPIQGSYPRVTVDIKWELKNDAGNDIICVTIPAKIN